MLLALVLASHALADFAAPYAPADFTLTNSTFANGSVDVSGAPASVVLTGPNDGTGLAGSTQWTAVSRANGVFRFKYSFKTLDLPDMDTAGYVVNGQYTQLASKDGQTGTVSISLRNGDTFGFRIESADNTGEAGVLTISDFSGPGAAPVPTLSYPAAAALAVLLCVLSLRLIRRGVSV